MNKPEVKLKHYSLYTYEEYLKLLHYEWQNEGNINSGSGDITESQVHAIRDLSRVSDSILYTYPMAFDRRIDISDTEFIFVLKGGEINAFKSMLNTSTHNNQFSRNISNIDIYDELNVHGLDSDYVANIRNSDLYEFLGDSTLDNELPIESGYRHIHFSTPFSSLERYVWLKFKIKIKIYTEVNSKINAYSPESSSYPKLIEIKDKDRSFGGKVAKFDGDTGLQGPKFTRPGTSVGFWNFVKSDWQSAFSIQDQDLLNQRIWDSPRSPDIDSAFVEDIYDPFYRVSSKPGEKLSKIFRVSMGLFPGTKHHIYLRKDYIAVGFFIGVHGNAYVKFAAATDYVRSLREIPWTPISNSGNIPNTIC